MLEKTVYSLKVSHSQTEFPGAPNGQKLAHGLSSLFATRKLKKKSLIGCLCRMPQPGGQGGEKERG